MPDIEKPELEKLHLGTLGAPLPAPGMLRLLAGPTGAVAIASQTAEAPLGADTDFRGLNLSAAGDWRSVATIHELVPAMPAWDASTRNGKLEIVYERAGGALNALILLSPPAAPVGITAAYPTGNFSRPRFAKSQSGAPDWVTAILDSKRCVALPVPEPGQYHALVECSDGLLLTDGPGYAFLYKVDIPGIARGIATLPGTLHLVALDAHLQPINQPVLISPEPIYEFDAQITPGNLFILGTTHTGCFLATRDNSGGRLKFRMRAFAAPPTLISPALFISSPGKLTIAALDSGKLVVAEQAIP